MTNTVFCFTPGSRRVDENIDSYSPQEVRLKNNMFNVTVPRKRVPKVNPEISSFFFFFYNITIYIQHITIFTIFLCLYFQDTEKISDGTDPIYKRRRKFGYHEEVRIQKVSEFL